jgi:hypothetical protein
MPIPYLGQNFQNPISSYANMRGDLKESAEIIDVLDPTRKTDRGTEIHGHTCLSS